MSPPPPPAHPCHISAPVRSEPLQQLCKQIPAGSAELCSGGTGEAEVEKGPFFSFFFSLFCYSSANEGQATPSSNICRQRQCCQACQRSAESLRSGATVQSQRKMKRRINKK